MDVDVDDPFSTRLLARAPVYDLVFACLSPWSLVQVALTCRAAYLAVVAFKNRAFNVNRHFSRHFTDPIAFRSLQAKTNTLVSGSSALQFLDRSFYPESDLDLYTHPGHSLEVARFLVEVEGYRYEPREAQERDWQAATKGDWNGTERRVVVPMAADHAYPDTDILQVWTFKKVGANRETLTVQVVEACSSPLECILGFHSTCVMNFISSDAAYSLYPIATFENRSALGMPPSQNSPAAVRKYVQRGWRVYFAPTLGDIANPMQSPFLLNEKRWVGDKHTWVLPLDKTGVEARPPLSRTSVPLTFDPVLFNGWKVRRHKGLESSYSYECYYYPLQSTVFRYNYAIPDEQTQLAIRHWASVQGMYSHKQVRKEDWVWFDADMPNLLPRM